jgi:Holliday junction resolvasome RuvABC ATP-dependent DNA helicase subunit
MDSLAVDSNQPIAVFKALRGYLNTQILGQERLVESMLVALLAEGHLLIEGPPGLAKTRAIKALAHGVECDFQRVQFTPDMLPGFDWFGHLSTRRWQFSLSARPVVPQPDTGR